MLTPLVLEHVLYLPFQNFPFGKYPCNQLLLLWLNWCCWRSAVVISYAVHNSSEIASLVPQITQFFTTRNKLIGHGCQLRQNLFRQPEVEGGRAEDPPGRFCGNHLRKIVHLLAPCLLILLNVCQFFVFCQFLGFHCEVVCWQITWSAGAPARDQFYTTAANCSFALSKSSPNLLSHLLSFFIWDLHCIYVWFVLVHMNN